MLVKRLNRTNLKWEAVAAGMRVLEDQHGAVQTLLNSMTGYTATAIAEIDTVTELIRNNISKQLTSLVQRCLDHNVVQRCELSILLTAQAKER
jgi:hypothetical protein